MTEFQNPILAGTTLVRAEMKSENYVPDVSGWILERNGDAELNNLKARGDITANSLNVETDEGNIRIQEGSTANEIEFDGTAGEFSDPATISTIPLPASSRLVLEAPLKASGSGTGNRPRITMETGDLTGRNIFLTAGTVQLGVGTTLNLSSRDVLSTLYRPKQTEDLNNQIVTATSFTGTGIGHFFSVPASGIVRVDWWFFFGIATTDQNLRRQMWGSWTIKTGSTVGSGSTVVGADASVFRSVSHAHEKDSIAESDTRMVGGASYIVEGLTPGVNNFNIELMTQCNVNDPDTTYTDFARRVITTPQF